MAGVRAGARATLARAITLVESRRPEHRALARQLLTRLMPYTGGARRIGVTGVPGVGKSTFITRFGLQLIEAGYTLAVLAVDPSSDISHGSILGDKTRMARISQDPRAFIRPSPSGGALGGVARRTREAMLLCEAAGFDVILVETVGVGQSEILVSEMTDFFLVLMLPGAGDELQGIKRGLLERADLIAVNKADMAPDRAASSARDYANALHFSRPPFEDWTPQVLTCSGQTGAGLMDIWAQIEAHRAAVQGSGRFEGQRRAQLRGWMWAEIEEGLKARFLAAPGVTAALPNIERQLGAGSLSPSEAADVLLGAFASELG